MDSSVALKDQIWFLHVCHHVSNVLYYQQLHWQDIYVTWQRTNYKLPEDDKIVSKHVEL